MEKEKDEFNYLWFYYLVFLIPLSLNLYIIISEIQGKENETMSEGIIVAIITGSITIILAIIGLILAGLKIANKKDTNKIEKISSETKNILGEKRDITIQGQIDIVNRSLIKNLENKDSNILIKLEKMNEFVTKEEVKKEVLGVERDFLKIIEEERTKDKLKISELTKSNVELIKEKIVLEKDFEDLKEKFEKYKRDNPGNNLGPKR